MTFSMLTEALENKSQQKSGRAITLPAPPPPRSLRFLDGFERLSAEAAFRTPAHTAKI